MNISELKERYDDFLAVEKVLRKDAVKVICDKVSKLISGSLYNKTLDYLSWVDSCCDSNSIVTVFLKYGMYDSGPVVAIAPTKNEKGDDSFTVQINGDMDDYYLDNDSLTLPQIMGIIEDLENLEESLSYKTDKGMVEWRVVEGLVEYIDEYSN